MLIEVLPNMSSNLPAHSNQDSKVDGASLLRFFLGYEDYWRLMSLLFLFGVTLGLSYFVYARATFQSTALIRVNQFVDSSSVAQGGRELNARLLRSVIQQLSSSFLILEAARDVGIANANTTHEELRNSVVPAVRVGVLDQNHLELSLVSYRPDVVRKLPSAIIESFEVARTRLQAEFRDKAVQRYADELNLVRKKVSDQLTNRLKFEEESSLANAQLELERLSDLPVQRVRARYKLQEYEEIARILKDQKDTLGTIGQLALYSNAISAQKDPLSSGRIVRRSPSSGTGPISFQSPENAKQFTQVVVQPDMVDGLEPWREIEKRMRNTEEKIRQNKAKFLDDHPQMIQLREELAESKSALELELSVAEKAFVLETERLKQELKDLDAKLPEYHRATKEFDEKKLGYDLMEKSQLAWDKAYEKLSQQIDKLQFNPGNDTVSLEFRGFTEMRSDSPVSPNKSQLAMLGCLFGLGLAGGIPFLLKRFDSSVVDLNEFEKTMGIPGIGLVPLSDPETLEEINRAPTVGATTPNALLENFRLIRSSILLNRSPKGDGHVVMVTSARPSEGKTTVSTNIAWAFSSMGDRTILVDCDLRRGRVHNVAGISNRPGLTDLLTDSVKLDDCIYKSEADNLWVIPRGPVLAGTTELLNTEVFSKIIDELKGRYDRIILDTPPILGLSETAFLQNHADGVVLIVKAGITLRRDVEDAVSSLRKLGAHFYGFVLNRVDFSKRRNHYYYYYYSSSYYDTNWEAEESLSVNPHKITRKV